MKLHQFIINLKQLIINIIISIFLLKELKTTLWTLKEIYFLILFFFKMLINVIFQFYYHLIQSIIFLLSFILRYIFLIFLLMIYHFKILLQICVDFAPIFSKFNFWSQWDY